MAFHLTVEDLNKKRKIFKKFDFLKIFHDPMLIVIEGIDGSGKTTQTTILVKKLQKLGYPVETLDFPQYQQFFGQMVKRFLKGEFGEIRQVNPYLASILYALDRWQTKEKLNKWLRQNKIIVLNRYTTANLLHQTSKLPPGKRQKYITWLEKLEYQILGLPQPNVVIYLYLPATLAYALINKRGKQKDIHEANLNHLQAAAAEGLKLATTKQNWHLVKCHRGQKILSRAEIAKKVGEIIASKTSM